MTAGILCGAAVMVVRPVTVVVTLIHTYIHSDSGVRAGACMQDGGMNS